MAHSTARKHHISLQTKHKFVRYRFDIYLKVIGLTFICQKTKTLIIDQHKISKMQDVSWLTLYGDDKFSLLALSKLSLLIACLLDENSMPYVKSRIRNATNSDDVSVCSSRLPLYGINLLGNSFRLLFANVA